MLPYRLAAVDLDDTLLGPDKLIGLENAHAIHRLRESGIHVVLASGRHHDNMLRFHQRLQLEGPIVSNNGAWVKNAETGEAWHEHTVPAHLASEIVAHGEERGITQNYYHTDGSLYVREATGWTDVYQTRNPAEPLHQTELADFHGDHALKIIWIDEASVIDALYTEFAARYGDALYVTTTDPEYLEFMAKGVSKAEGVGVVAARMGLTASQVIAFGDGNNDVPLLEWAGHSIAMSHARASAKAAAKQIAPPGNPETSFTRAVEMLFDSV